MTDWLDFFSVYILGGIEILTGFYFFVRFLQRKIPFIYHILFAVIATVVIPSGGITQFLVYVLLLIAAGVLAGKTPPVLIVLYAVMTTEIMHLCYGIVNSVSCTLIPLFPERSALAGLLFMAGSNILSLTLSILCYQVVSRYFVQKEIVGAKYVLLILLPALFVFLISEYISTNVYGNVITVGDGRIDPYPILLIQVLGLTSLFCILYAWQKLLERFQLGREVALLERERHFLNRYVEEAKTRYEKTRSFRHDVKNHMLLVKELIQNGNTEAALSYMGDMEHLTADLSFPVSTNNPVLDILIGYKLGAAQSNQIEVQCSFIAPCPCEIADIDLCIIFSNALDNAIAACCQNGHDGPGYIRITGKLQGSFMLIEIQNSYRGTGNIHRGTGLNNIRAVAEKYHGTMEIQTDEESFTLSVLLMY